MRRAGYFRRLAMVLESTARANAGTDAASIHARHRWQRAVLQEAIVVLAGLGCVPQGSGLLLPGPVLPQLAVCYEPNPGESWRQLRDFQLLQAVRSRDEAAQFGLLCAAIECHRQALLSRG